MQPLSLRHIASALLFIFLAGQLLCANQDNPYAAIVDRNPFGLKPPPPPPPPPEQTAPPVPMAKVVLTGLISMFGEPRALFEIVEDPKTGGTPKKPILRQGEREGTVEVLAIDVAKNSVRIRNAGVETNMTFEVAKSGPAPGGPGVPGAPPALTPMAAKPYTAQPDAGAPLVISRNDAMAGGGVTLVGGASATPMSTAMNANVAGVPGALGYASGAAMPNIPPRPLRTDTASADSPPPMTRDQAALLIEAQRMRGGPPLPPTHLTPIIQGAEQEGSAPPNPSPFPQFPPAPRGRPPAIPGR